MNPKKKQLSFDDLALNIQQIHKFTSKAAKSAVNQALTARNWAVGLYIVEYEQDGKERSSYGNYLLVDLVEKISVKTLECSVQNICRLFYLNYPTICEAVSHKLQAIGLHENILSI